MSITTGSTDPGVIIGDELADETCKDGSDIIQKIFLGDPDAREKLNQVLRIVGEQEVFSPEEFRSFLEKLENIEGRTAFIASIENKLLVRMPDSEGKEKIAEAVELVKNGSADTLIKLTKQNITSTLDHQWMSLSGGFAGGVGIMLLLQTILHFAR